MSKPSQAILDHAFEICEGLKVPDGKPYRPANSTEGEIFEGHWCQNCKIDCDACKISIAAYLGDHPTEWFYWNGAPLCSAWNDKTAPAKPRKRKAKPTPLLDWMDDQVPYENKGADWMDSISGTIVLDPEPVHLDEPEVIPVTGFKVGDYVTCRPIASGRQPWSGWFGEIEDIEGDLAYLRFDEYPLYPVLMDRLEHVSDSDLTCDGDDEPDPSAVEVGEVSALKEWRWWEVLQEWTYTGHMGSNITTRFRDSKLFPAGVDPNFAGLNSTELSF